MPTRLIRDGILTSDRVNELDWEAEVFYRRLMSVVDDFGLYDSRPVILRSVLYPLKLDVVREAHIERCLKIVEAARLVRFYVVDGKPFLQIESFGQQSKSQPKWPVPPWGLITSKGEHIAPLDCSRYDSSPPVTNRNESLPPVTKAKTKSKPYSDTNKTIKGGNSKIHSGSMQPAVQDTPLIVFCRKILKGLPDLSVDIAPLTTFEKKAAAQAFNVYNKLLDDRMELLLEEYFRTNKKNSRGIDYPKPGKREAVFEQLHNWIANAEQYAKEWNKKLTKKGYARRNSAPVNNSKGEINDSVEDDIVSPEDIERAKKELGIN